MILTPPFLNYSLWLETCFYRHGSFNVPNNNNGMFRNRAHHAGDWDQNGLERPPHPTLGYTMFPMANAPQPLLNAFDYNGDGIIGYNDQAIVLQMVSSLQDIFLQEFGPPSDEYEDGYPPEAYDFPIPTPEWYRENWESYAQEYGEDLFPNPNDYFQAFDYSGNLSESPDADLASASGLPDSYGGQNNGLYTWQGNFRDYMNLVYTAGFLSSAELAEYAGGNGVINGFLPTSIIRGSGGVGV